MRPCQRAGCKLPARVHIQNVVKPTLQRKDVFRCVNHAVEDIEAWFDVPNTNEMFAIKWL